MKKSVVLIAEDEESLAKTLALNLKIEGYEVIVASGGTQALECFNAQSEHLELALLDVMLPGINGFDLCAEFKKRRPTLPVIFLTAKSAVPDRISGLKLGADDYIVKPFELEELLLRISNVVKRKNPAGTTKLFVFENGNINFDTFEITTRAGQKLELSRREMGLLRLLTERENMVVSRDEIIECLWDVNENASSRTIDNYILMFRKYFEADPRKPKHFHSVRGVGYKFTA